MTRFRPSPAMVVAFLALLVSLTSGAYAAVRITTANLADGAVTHRKLSNNSVWNRNLGTPAVRTANINNGAVTHSKMGQNVIWNAQLGRPAVRTVNINDGAVTHPKLAAGAVDSTNLSAALLSQLNRPAGSNPGAPVVTVPALTAGQKAQGYPQSGQAGDQGWFFSGLDAQGSARLSGGQLLLHGVGLSMAPTPVQGAIGIAKLFSGVALSHLDQLSYQWHVNQPNGNQAPTIHIWVTGLTANSTFGTGFANLTLAPGIGPNGVTVNRGQLYQTDGFGAGTLWFSTTAPAGSPGSIADPQPMAFFVNHNPNAVIHQISLDNGGSSGATTGSFEAGVDNLIIGFTGARFTRYDFDS